MLPTGLQSEKRFLQKYWIHEKCDSCRRHLDIFLEFFRQHGFLGNAGSIEERLRLLLVLAQRRLHRSGVERLSVRVSVGAGAIGVDSAASRGVEGTRSGNGSGNAGAAMASLVLPLGGDGQNDADVGDAKTEKQKSAPQKRKGADEELQGVAVQQKAGDEMRMANKPLLLGSFDDITRG